MANCLINSLLFVGGSVIYFVVYFLTSEEIRYPESVSNIVSIGAFCVYVFIIILTKKRGGLSINQSSYKDEPGEYEPGTDDDSIDIPYWYRWSNNDDEDDDQDPWWKSLF